MEGSPSNLQTLFCQSCHTRFRHRSDGQLWCFGCLLARSYDKRWSEQEAPHGKPEKEGRVHQDGARF